MENTIYIGLSRLSALQTNMDLIANNIANINTPGYKASKMVFAEYLDKPKGMNETLAMVEDYGNFRVTESGPMKRTDNPLDVALEGQGFIGVQGPNNKTMYTRAGTFALDTQGNLVTQQGYKVLDSGGSAITIPATAKDIAIDQAGNIATEEGVIAQLKVDEFDNLQKVTPTGNGLYTTDQTPTPAADTKVVQGAVEGSNTQGVLEMTDMIAVSRDYQSVARMLQNEHDRIRSTIKSLTQGQ